MKKNHKHVDNFKVKSELEPIMEMNMTPLIDVMLVLIVMLIITIPIQKHVVKIDQPSPVPHDVIALPFVNFIDINEKNEIFWNSEPILELPLLEAKLAGVVQKGNTDEVHIRPHKDSAYKVLARVLAATQRSGVSKLGIIGNEQFVEDKELWAP